MSADFDYTNSECIGNTDPACPYCGNEDFIEYGDEGSFEDGDEWARTCMSCEKEYMVRTSVSYTFDSAKIEEEE